MHKKRSYPSERKGVLSGFSERKEKDGISRGTNYSTLTRKREISARAGGGERKSGGLGKDEFFIPSCKKSQEGTRKEKRAAMFVTKGGGVVWVKVVEKRPVCPDRLPKKNFKRNNWTSTTP